MKNEEDEKKTKSATKNKKTNDTDPSEQKKTNVKKEKKSSKEKEETERKDESVKEKKKEPPTKSVKLSTRELKVLLILMKMFFSFKFSSVIFFLLFLELENNDYAFISKFLYKKELLGLLFSFAFPPLFPDLVFYCVEPPLEHWYEIIQYTGITQRLSNERKKKD